MKEYAPAQLRNVGLFSHGGAGKTTLTEALLYRAGAITRVGSIEDGNTTTDFDPEELKRQMSVSLALAPLEWQGHKINLLDAPGYADFYGEVAEAVRVADGALVLVDAVAGPQVGTDAVWKRAAHLPRLIVVNKMDRENADYRGVLDQLRERYGKGVVPLTLSRSARPTALSGVIDLMDGKAYPRRRRRARAVPDSERGSFDQLREMLVESACELDDELINKYLEGEEITTEELAKALRAGIRDRQAVSRAGHLEQSLGWARAAARCDRAAAAVTARPRHSTRRATRRRRRTKSSPRWCSRPVSDPNIGRLSYVRVYSGTLSADSHVWNVQKSKDERVGQVFHIRGKTPGADASASPRATSASFRSWPSRSRARR